MKSSRGAPAVLAVGWCCFVAATAVVMKPRDCDAQDHVSAIPYTNPSAIDSDASGTSLTLEETVTYGSCGCRQVWSNALFLSRSSSSRQSLVYNGPKGSTILWTDDLDFDFGWGPSLGITFCYNPCHPYNRIGMEFYAIDGWSSTVQAAGNNSVQFPSQPYLPELGVPGDSATGYGVATFHYSSNLSNTEVNFYHQSGNVCWLTGLAGFRWIELGEDFNTVFATGATTPNYAIDVNNHLYGFQVGTLANLQNYGPLRLEGWIKGGVFGNAADQHTTEDFTSAGGRIISASAYSANVAFAGDLGCSVACHITSRLSVRFSYMALWIEGIALAPEQLDNSDPSNSIASLDHSGGTFYHGGFVGGEYLW